MNNDLPTDQTFTFGIEDLADTAECLYCKSDFKPRHYPPKKDELYWTQQLFCSRLCKKLYKEERTFKIDQDSS
jgi:hypothetical protein